MNYSKQTLINIQSGIYHLDKIYSNTFIKIYKKAFKRILKKTRRMNIYKDVEQDIAITD